MSDETIFAAAVEKLDSTERSAYLDSACAGNADQRKRLDALLTAHDRAGEFLARPAVAPPEPEHAPTRAFSPDPGADHTRTHGGVAETDTDDALGFLAAPRRADSLGRIGHYEVLEVLGRGGFGIVFRAFDEVLQRVVAVKVLAPSMAVTSPARKRFLREARSSASVRHENVVHVYAVEEQPLPYLVMEFIPGETLQQRLDRTGPLDVPEILRIGRQIALGLAAAHDMGLIHRDIKPSNILIDNGPQERVKITDFGLARAADDASISQSGVVAGTPMYMAPEQAKGDALDHRADLFSLGSVLYVMCTGRPPFRASGTLAVLKRVCEEDPRPIREVIPEVPEWLCRVIEKLHAKKPDDRFQSAKEVAEVLADCEKQLLTHTELKDHSRIPLAKPRPVRRTNAWRWAAFGVAFVLFVCGILYSHAAMLYWNHEGQVLFKFDTGWESVTVLHDGQPVTDSLNVLENPRIELPPGHYTIKAGLRSPMDEIFRWEITEYDLSGFQPTSVTSHFFGGDVGLDVKRGRRVAVRALINTRSPSDLQRDLDRKDLQGDWVAEKVEVQNRALPSVDCRKFRLAIKGESARLSLPDGRIVDGKLSLDASRFPKEIDFYGTDSKWVKGIYQVSINTLTLAIGDIGRERPVAFLSGIDPGSKQMMVTLRRVTTVGDGPGFVSLFNGKDLTGWKTVYDTKRYRAGPFDLADGILMAKGQPEGYVRSLKPYHEFHLRLEYRAPAVTPTDLGLYGAILWEMEDADAAWPQWPPSMRLELGRKYGNPLAILYETPAERSRFPRTLVEGAPAGAGEWNRLEIICKGGQLEVDQNGKRSSFPNYHPRPGFLALQSASEGLQFRKIEIKELPASPKTPEQIAREDSARLVGEWIVRDGKVDQRALTAQPILERKLSFLKDGMFLLPMRDDSGYLFPITGVYTLDTAKKQITFNVQGLGNFVRCAYHVDGDTLVLDFPEPKDGDGQTELFAFGDQRLASQAHLKALGIAMLNYADKHSDALPPAAITDPKDKEGKPLLSWRVALLPCLNQESLYKEFKLDEPWDSEHNKKLIEKMPKVYAIPGAAAPRGHSHYRVFVGPGTAFEPRPVGAKGLRTIDFLDGLASTILVVEAADPVIWTRPVDLPYDPRKPLPRLGTFQDGAQVLMADATVWRLSSRATEKDIRGAIEHSDGRGIAEQLLKRFPSRGPAIHLELQRQIAPPQPVLLKSFDPAREKAVAPRGDPKFITVENGAWRIENALADSMSGNFNVLLATVTENIPADGIVICRAKVKLQPKDKNAWGDLMLGQASPSFHGYNWPKQLAEYRGEITEWTQKEVRYPIEVFHKKNPASIPIYVGLHANGVLWVKDLELLYLPAPSKPAPPAAVAPFDAAKAKELQEAWAKHLGVPVETTNSIGMKLRLIPPGEFTMGSAKEEIDWLLTQAPDLKDAEMFVKDWVRSEGPDRRMTIGEPFLLGAHEVTVGEFRMFVKATGYKTDAETAGGGFVWNVEAKKWERKPDQVWSNPQYSGGENHPVKFVTSDDVRAFCAWLGKQDGRKYVIPTEEQWEYACRAGTATRWSFGDDPAPMRKHGWTVPHASGKHHPVGQLAANPFGLFDVYGNAGELVLTAHGEEYQRGGTAGESPLRARSASRVPVRGDLDPIWTRGFRVAVVGDLKGKLPGDPAALQPLRDLVAATAHTRDTVKARLEAGRVSRIDLLVAEASLTEARIRLARAQGDRGAVIGLHEVLVALRREERNLIAERVKAGVAAENELNQADARLADARARLAKEKPPSPVAPAPRQKP